jgi:hypothetical protein
MYRSVVTAKERLRRLVEDLSEREAEITLVIVERRRSDPMLPALAQAAAGDEPSSPQEDRSAREALAAHGRGEQASSPDELSRDRERALAIESQRITIRSARESGVDAVVTAVVALLRELRGATNPIQTTEAERVCRSLICRRPAPAPSTPRV